MDNMLPPQFGPMRSIGRLLAGEKVTDDEFLKDESPWVVVHIPAEAVALLGDMDPLTPEQARLAAE